MALPRRRIAFKGDSHVVRLPHGVMQLAAAVEIIEVLRRKDLTKAITRSAIPKQLRSRVILAVSRRGTEK